jgi:hypothetical protein
MKVIKNDMSTGYSIVVDAYGENRATQQGLVHTYVVYAPLPIARIPSGYGRTDQEAKELADKICQLLNANQTPEMIALYRNV